MNALRLWGAIFGLTTLTLLAFLLGAAGCDAVIAWWRTKGRAERAVRELRREIQRNERKKVLL